MPARGDVAGLVPFRGLGAKRLLAANTFVPVCRALDAEFISAR